MNTHVASAFGSRALELKHVALAASRRGEQAGLRLGPVDVTEQDAAEQDGPARPGVGLELDVSTAQCGRDEDPLAMPSNRAVLVNSLDVTKRGAGRREQTAGVATTRCRVEISRRDLPERLVRVPDLYPEKPVRTS